MTAAIQICFGHSHLSLRKSKSAICTACQRYPARAFEHCGICLRKSFRGREPEQHFRHQADRIRHQMNKRGTDDRQHDEEIDCPYADQRREHEWKWAGISKRCDDKARQPNESAIPSATASAIWTVTPKATGAAGTSALIPAAVVRRAPTSQGRRLSLQRKCNPRYFGKAAGRRRR